MDRWLNRFSAYIARKGLRRSRPREVVAEEFFKSGHHVGIESLYRQVQKANSAIGIATVYRTLNLLAESGLAVRRDFATGGVVYEKTLGKHHDHMLCTSCGKIVEFHNAEIERLQDGVATQHGFSLRFHKMELYGLCKKCLRREKKGRDR